MKRVILSAVVALMVLSGTSLVFSDVFTRVIDNGLESVNISNTAATSPAAVNENYTVIGWNDLGMHCISPSFKDMAILPPYNNLIVQVIQRGDLPLVITDGVTVEYFIKNNTTVSGKTDFWQYVQGLFGVNPPEGIGLTGNGLSGTMQPVGDHFEATGIPILPRKDSTKWTPYQTAVVKVKNASGAVIAKTWVVIPVSDELNCGKCHGTTDTEINILSLHDSLSGTSLMSQRPVLCADCHADNALGLPGDPALPSLSEAMHGRHASLGANAPACYDCHPGPKTNCNRSAIRGMGASQGNPNCENCHGTLQHVADSLKQGRVPWLQEPTCEQCHGANYATGTDLYRNAQGHGGIYCAACHNSPHAWYPSKNPLDNRQPLMLQGSPGPLHKCTICHVTRPAGKNPHNAQFTGHPADWFTAHRASARTNGVTSCKVCHGTDLRGSAGPSCYTCHGAVWKNPHPMGWRNSHKDYVESNGTSSCKKCHGTDLKGGSGPSCYTCHGSVWLDD